MKRDFYEILGIQKGAPKDEIKAAYRNMALKFHPDRNKEPDAEEKFKEINEAYEVLSNDQKKSAYDQYGHAAFDPSSGGFNGRTYTNQSDPFTSYTWSGSGGQNPFGNADFDFGGFSNPFDIFEQFFGGNINFGQTQRQQRVPTYKIQLTFLEAALGCQKEVQLEGKTKKLRVPAGVDDGQRIKFSDFILYVDVLPDKIFKRDGNDVYVTQEITLKQAILGDDLEVPTLEDRLKIRVKPGTQPNTLVRLQGRGIRDVNGFGRGDLYIRLNITIPARLNTKQKELIKELDL